VTNNMSASDELRQRQAIERAERDGWAALFNGSEYPCSFAFITKYCMSPADGAAPLTSQLLLIIDGSVYDATVFAPTHKAGLFIIKKNVGNLNCGEVFHRIHGANAHKQLEGMRLGALVGAPAAASLLAVPSAAPGKGMMPAKKVLPKKKGFVVFETEQVSHNTKRITFAAPERLALLPGGHVMVTAPQKDGTVEKRSYTPYDIQSTTFSLLVKVYPGGKGSGYLNSIRAGEFVEVSDPIEPEVDAQALLKRASVVLVAGGTGVAPIYTVAKHLLSVAGGPRVHLFACFRDEHDVLLGVQLEHLQEEFPGRLNLHFVFSRADLSRFHNCVAFTGRFNERHIAHVVNAADAAVVCGPPSFGDDVVRVLGNQLSIPSNNVVVL
jgi:NAD(P)H-flavin reductase